MYCLVTQGPPKIRFIGSTRMTLHKFEPVSHPLTMEPSAYRCAKCLKATTWKILQIIFASQLINPSFKILQNKPLG